MFIVIVGSKRSKVFYFLLGILNASNY